MPATEMPWSSDGSTTSASCSAATPSVLPEMAQGDEVGGWGLSDWSRGRREVQVPGALPQLKQEDQAVSAFGIRKVGSRRHRLPSAQCERTGDPEGICHVTDESRVQRPGHQQGLGPQHPLQEAVDHDEPVPGDVSHVQGKRGINLLLLLVPAA